MAPRRRAARAALLGLLLAYAAAAPDQAQLNAVEAKIKETRAAILGVYGTGVDAAEFAVGVDFLAGAKGRDQVVERLLRAFALGDSFVVAVGGMSDVAGHGNLFDEAYPNVCGDALRPVFEKAGVRFAVRNMAMGGVPSFPNSVCMGDNFGRDADVIVWDFRMVERDADKGELYIRQALMLPRGPSIVFKRKQG